MTRISDIRSAEAFSEQLDKDERKTMSQSSSSSNGGIGFVGLLTIVFITLKLCGVIHWSWWWVWSPMLIAICVVTVLLTIYLVVVTRGRHL